MKTTYVPDASTISSIPQDDKRLNKRLADAAVVFLEVRLNSLKDLQVHRSKSPCPSEGARPSEGDPLETNAPDSYEVRTAIRTLAVSGLNEYEKELVLDYELVKYVRCKPTILVHRSEPISEKTAFDGFLQMGDVLEINLQNELAPPKIRIDVAEISIEDEALQSVRDDLVSRVFVRLATESDFTVRDIRGKQPSKDTDYVITGLLTKDRKGVAFTIKNAIDASKNQSPFVPGAISQKNSEGLNAFYNRAAETLISYIRVCSFTPLADDEIGKSTLRASELLCKDTTACEPRPAEAILVLTRLSCAGKQTPATLALSGDAYLLSEDFLKAADAYDQSWKLLGADRPEETVPIVILAGDAWYRAQNYGNAAQRYEMAIARSPEAQPPSEAVYLQRARSYRFAADRQQALAAGIDGLTKYPTSDQLAGELNLAVKNISGDQLRSSYDKLFLKNTNIDAINKVLPAVREKLGDYLLGEVFDKLLEKKDLKEVGQLLKLAETLPLTSLPQEFQDAYKITRAVWQRDAKNDWENAVAVLGPFSEQNSEMGEVAKYFLADTYYQRARRSNNKDDYEKSVTLFKKLIEGGLFPDDELLWVNLTIANHQLDRDRDTRDFLDQKLQQNPDAKAGEALVSLCLNHFKDLQCAEKTIKQFEAGLSAEDFKVRKLELHVVRAEYAKAEKLLLSITSPSLGENEVWLFYQAWTQFALEREKDGQAALRLWHNNMESARRAGESTRWVFDAANQALDAEVKLATPRKELLRRMLEAMADKTRPLPSIANPMPRAIR